MLREAGPVVQSEALLSTVAWQKGMCPEVSKIFFVVVLYRGDGPKPVARATPRILSSAPWSPLY